MRNISSPKSSSNTSTLSTAEGVVWCCAFALEAALIVIGNLLTIVVFALNKKLRAKKSLFLVINMAFADLMFGAVALPLYIYFYGDDHQLWTATLPSYRKHVSLIFQVVSKQASLISAFLISAERFYAIYWPLKHRTMTERAYRIVIFMAWTVTTLVSTLILLFSFLTSNGLVVRYCLLSYLLILLLTACGCNIGIWRKFQHRRIASQQQNRASQNQRLTKILLFVSLVALLSWLPVICVRFILGTLLSAHSNIYHTVRFLCFSNSFINPVVYAFRIPEFKQALGNLCRFKVQAVKSIESGDNRATALTPVTLLEIRKLKTVPSVSQEDMDSKLTASTKKSAHLPGTCTFPR